MRSRIELPCIWRDHEACDLDHGKARGRNFPISRAVRPLQNAPVVGRVEIAGDGIKCDTRRGEVRERCRSRSIEIRPCRCARTWVVPHREDVAGCRRRQ